jgi:hypothetical protein
LSMLGVALGLGTSAVAAALGIRTYRKLVDPSECRLIESYLAAGGNLRGETFRRSRPGALLSELADVCEHPELMVAAFNDALSEVDTTSRTGRQAAKLLARSALMAGVAGACAELALNIHVSALYASCWSLAALFAGVVGAASCTVIGQRASVGLLRRRQLWDDFVQWILKSRLSPSELIVPVQSEEMDGGVRKSHQS